jgi:hypothetical protein
MNQMLGVERSNTGRFASLVAKKNANDFQKAPWDNG